MAKIWQIYQYTYRLLQNRYIDISQGTKDCIHQVKMGQAMGYSFSLEVQKLMELQFTLSEQINGVVKQIGEGSLVIKSQDIGREGERKQCIIYSNLGHEQMVTLQIGITCDLQNQGYSDVQIPVYSQQISGYEQLSQKGGIISQKGGIISQKGAQILGTSQISSHIQTQSQPVYSPFRQVSPSKKRRPGCKIRKKENNVSIVNQIKENSTNLLENMRIDLDQAISQIRINDGKQFIATIDFETNPSSQDLRNIQLRIPQKSTQLNIFIIKMDAQMYNSVLKLPKLRQCESLRLEHQIENSQHEKIGRILVNYKKEQKVGQASCGLIKLAMGQEDPINPNYEGQKMSKFDNMGTNGIKQEFKTIDPNYARIWNKKRISKMQSNVISQCFLPQIRKVSCYTQQGQSQLMPIQQPINKYQTLPIGLDPLQNRDRHSSFEKATDRKAKLGIQLKYVSIKFNQSYMKISGFNRPRQFYRQKFLHIYFKPKQVYRSKNAIGGQTLNWELNDCHFQVNQQDLLTIELTQYQHKLFIGQFTISFNQLRYNYARTDFLTGDLFDGQTPIAKIKIQFALNDSIYQPNRGRTTQITNRRRAITIKKPNLSVSQIDLTPIHNSHKNKKLYEQIQDRNRRPTKSPKKRIRTQIF